METKDDKTNWQRFEGLTTAQLVITSCAFTDELKRRREETLLGSPEKHRLYLLAESRMVEARAYLRTLQSVEHEERALAAMRRREGGAA